MELWARFGSASYQCQLPPEISPFVLWLGYNAQVLTVVESGGDYEASLMISPVLSAEVAEKLKEDMRYWPVGRLLPPLGTVLDAMLKTNFINAWKGLGDDEFGDGEGVVLRENDDGRAFYEHLMTVQLDHWVDINATFPVADWLSMIHPVSIPLWIPRLPEIPLSISSLSVSVIAGFGQIISAALPASEEHLKSTLGAALRTELGSSLKTVDNTKLLATVGLVVGSVATLGLGILGGVQLWSTFHPKKSLT
jgi:hypothetical protein